MTAITFLLVILSLLTHSIEANVEKVVFLGPEQTSEHSHLPHHTLLTHIEWLNPTNTTIRRKIHATFEDNSYTSVQQEQQEAWVLLNGLEARQRYEVRVCWPATVSGHMRTQDRVSYTYKNYSNLRFLTSQFMILVQSYNLKDSMSH